MLQNHSKLIYHPGRLTTFFETFQHCSVVVVFIASLLPTLSAAELIKNAWACCITRDFRYTAITTNCAAAASCKLQLKFSSLATVARRCTSNCVVRWGVLKWAWHTDIATEKERERERKLCQKL